MFCRVVLGDRAGRARGHPPWAHAGSVGAALPHRLRCAAQPGRARQNSLRGLRLLRSNSCRESVRDARAEACASPGPALLAAPEIAHAGCLLPRPAPPVARPYEGHRRWRKGACGQPAARLCAAEKRRVRGPRAQRASTSDSRRVFERSGRRPRSEFRRGPSDPSIAGNPRAAGARASIRSAAGCPHGPLLAPPCACPRRLPTAAPNTPFHRKPMT